MEGTDEPALPRLTALTCEEQERATQLVWRWAKLMTLSELRLARARLADLLAQNPPEPIASHMTIRGQIAHSEVLRRERGEGMLSGFKRIFSLDGVGVQLFTTFRGWNDRKGQ